MFKKYKNFIFIIISLLILILILFIIFRNVIEKNNVSLIKIATCPTFYSKLSQLNSSSNYSVILTSSTSASLKMLEDNEVNYALGGRVLMPEEASFSFEVIGDGFSFLSDKTKSIYDYNLVNYTIYSDLNIDLLRANFGDLNYQKVDIVYNYLENNIVITSWENTDYSQSEIVHILKADNNRNIKSRIPIVFCQNICNDDIIKDIKNIIN